MNHHGKHRTLGRERKGRVALMRSLARSLILHEKIETTLARAKELRPFIDTCISASKANDIASRRKLAARLASASTVKKLHDTIAPRYANRHGGYTRIVRLAPSAKRFAEMARIELV